MPDKTPSGPALKLAYLREVAAGFFRALRARGPAGTLRQGVRFVQRRYLGKRGAYLPPEQEYERQRREDKSGWPTVSFVLQGAIGAGALAELYKQLERQTHTGWELVGADEALRAVEDERVRCAALPLQAAGGELVALLPPGYALAPHAAYHLARAALAGTAALFYPDDAPFAGDIHAPGTARFKPEFLREYFYCYDYIGPFVALRRPLLAELGAPDEAFGAAAHVDFLLRALETGAVPARIPHVLAYAPALDEAAFAPHHRRAVAAHLARTGVKAQVLPGLAAATSHVLYPLVGTPLISVIIPTSDHAEDLQRCLASVYEKTSYPNFEVVLVENNSKEAETFELYERLCAGHDNCRVARYEEKGFHYARLCNFGRAAARGEYLLFLNNDTEVITPDWMEQMLRYAQRPDVGLVGALLLYADGSVQHAGMFTGWPGHAFHSHRGVAGEGYMHRILCEQELACVTGACQLISTGRFDAAGGYNEDFPVDYNDVDLCFKLRRQGLRVVYTPHAQLYHYESKTRDNEPTPERRAEGERHAQHMRKLWGDWLLEDGHYSPSLSTTAEDLRAADEIQDRRMLADLNAGEGAANGQP